MIPLVESANLWLLKSKAYVRMSCDLTFDCREFENLVLNSIYLIEWLNLTLLLCCVGEVDMLNWYAVSSDLVLAVLSVFGVLCNLFFKNCYSFYFIYFAYWKDTSCVYPFLSKKNIMCISSHSLVHVWLLIPAFSVLCNSIRLVLPCHRSIS